MSSATAVTNPTSGRKRLMDAALKLSGRTRSIHALGIRELAREAGVNPNTFYRHFRDLDELGLAVLEDVVEELREPLRELRRNAKDEVLADEEVPADDALRQLELAGRVIHRCFRRYFEFAVEHPEAFIIGSRELTGPSPVLRNAIREAMEVFARDTARDLQQLPLPSDLDENVLAQLAWFINRQSFHVSLDYIERPDQRELICQRLEKQITMMLVGACVLHSAASSSDESFSSLSSWLFLSS